LRFKTKKDRNLRKSSAPQNRPGRLNREGWRYKGATKWAAGRDELLEVEMRNMHSGS
jgi:hypothetical protein